MEWITDYWFVILLGLVAVLVFFGFRISDNKEGNMLIIRMNLMRIKKSIKVEVVAATDIS